MSRESTPRYAQTAGDFGFAVQFNAETRTAPLSSGWIVPRVTLGRVTSFIPRERPNANTRYYRLFKATTAYNSACTDVGAALAPLLSRGTRVCHWQSTRRVWPDTRRPQLPLDDCCRLVLPYNAELQFKLYD